MVDSQLCFADKIGRVRRNVDLRNITDGAASTRQLQKKPSDLDRPRLTVSQRRFKSMEEQKKPHNKILTNMDYSCSEEEKEDDSSSGRSNFDEDDNDFAYKVEIIITVSEANENTAECNNEVRRVK